MTYSVAKPSTVKQGSIKRAHVMGTIGVYLFLILGAIVMILPLLWMVESSLKTKEQFLTTQLSLAFPKNPQWGNYFKRIYSNQIWIKIYLFIFL